MDKRGDEIDDVIWLLERLIKTMEEPDMETVPVSGAFLNYLISLLSRVPKPTGNVRNKIRGREEVREAVARGAARARKAELVNKGMSAVQAELQVAEESVPLFRRITGRELKPDTIRRIMQGKRSRRSRKSRRKI